MFPWNNWRTQTSASKLRLWNKTYKLRSYWSRAFNTKPLKGCRKNPPTYQLFEAFPSCLTWHQGAMAPKLCIVKKNSSNVSFTKAAILWNGLYRWPDGLIVIFVLLTCRQERNLMIIPGKISFLSQTFLPFAMHHDLRFNCCLIRFLHR